MRLSEALTILALFIQPTLNLICNTSSPLYHLKIVTEKQEKDTKMSYAILDKCEVNKFFTNQTQNLVFIDQQTQKTLLRFSSDYPNNSNNYQAYSIFLHSKILEGHGSVQLSFNNFTLHPGETIDTYLHYNIPDEECEFFKVQLDIEFNHNKNITIQTVKLCQYNFLRDSLDISHLIILIILTIIIFASVLDIFTSKFEEIILNKYPEIRSPEKLTVISIVIALILWILCLIEFSNIFITFILFFVIIISIAMLFEGLLKHTSFKSTLSYRTLEFDFLGSISMFFLLCLAIGLIVYIIYQFTNNWIISDFISIAISIETIRIWKFNSFKVLFLLCLAIWLYDLYYVLSKTIYYNEHLKITYQFDTKFPILILCPHFSFGFFRKYTAVPIGEIIIPGLIINYFWRFDKFIKSDVQSKYIYFKSSLVILIISFCIKFFVFSLWDIYIPMFFIFFIGIVVIVMGIAFMKKHFKYLLGEYNVDDVFGKEELEEKKLEKFTKEISFRNSGIKAIEMKFI